MSKSPLTCHVLDTTRGRPARGLAVQLERAEDDGSWRTLARGLSDDDGRVLDLLAPGALEARPRSPDVRDRPVL